MAAAVTRSPRSAGPAEPGAQVGELDVHPIERRPWPGARRRAPSGRRPARRSRRRDGPGPRRSCRWRPVASSANWRIVSNIPYRAWSDRCVDGDQRLAHQRVQAVQHRVLVGSVAAHVRRRRRASNPPANTEQRRSTARSSSSSKSYDHCTALAQRLVAFHAGRDPDKQPEPVTETVADILGAHRHHPGRRQLDRQRDPIEAPTDLDHRRRAGIVVERKLGFTAVARSTNNSTAAEPSPPSAPATAPATTARPHP